MEITLLVLAIVGLALAGIQTHYSRRQTRLAEQSSKEADELKQSLAKVAKVLEKEQLRADAAEAKMAAVHEAAKEEKALVRIVSQVEMRAEIEKRAKEGMVFRTLERHPRASVSREKAAPRVSILVRLERGSLAIIQITLWGLTLLAALRLLAEQGKSVWDLIRGMF